MAMKIRQSILRTVLSVTFAFALVASGPVMTPTVAASTIPHYLIFSGTYGFRHDGIQEAVAHIRHMGTMTGAYTIEWSEDASVFEPALYDRVDGVVMLQTTGIAGGSSPLTATQKQDIIRFFGCGGAFVGVHAAADSGSGWPEYTDLIGALFDSHPHYSFETRDNPIDHHMFNPRWLSDIWIQVEEQEHAATGPWHGTDRFRMTEELYRWRDDPREVHADTPEFRVLLSLDEESHYWPKDTPFAGELLTISAPGPNPVQQIPFMAFPEDSPLAWTKSYGEGRVFYTNLGHNVSTWDRPDFRDHVFEGMRWAAEQRPDRTCVSGGN
jgi:type 1 glutamine amidotransferase